MSFPRHPEIYPPMEAQTNAAYAPLIAWMSFRLVIPWRVALLRNRVYGDELKAQFFGLRMQFCALPVLSSALLFLEDGRVVFLLLRDHEVDDPCQLVRGCGHRFRSIHASLHPAKVVAQEALAVMQTLSPHS